MTALPAFTAEVLFHGEDIRMKNNKKKDFRLAERE